MKKKTPLFLILAAGILTPAAATLLFYLAPPKNITARGEILPPTRAPEQWNLEKDGKWTLLFASETCGALCQKRLCLMRQLRLSLPGAYPRIRRVWLRPPSATNITEDISASADCGEPRAAAFAAEAKTVNITEGVLQIRGEFSNLPAAKQIPPEKYLYVIDPSGFYALRFAPDLDGYAVGKDVKKLLKISKNTKRAQNGGG